MKTSYNLTVICITVTVTVVCISLFLQCIINCTISLSIDTSTLNCPPPELIMTEADSIADPDSDDEPERKDSLDVHEEGQISISLLTLKRVGGIV